jgi:phospholipid-binding lipoprotein MlaA
MIKNGMKDSLRIFSICICVSVLPACASRQNLDTGANDPFEAYNRSMYKFNTAFDSVTLKPAAKAYNAIAPAPARRGVDNVMQNLQEPWTMVNSLLQGKINNMFNSLGRFIVNSTLGFGGFADRATEWKIPHQEEDFGQTLAVWGMPEGPYFMMPFLGPSNIRDTAGFTANFFGDPVSYGLSEGISRYASWSRTAIDIGNFRAKALKTVDPVLDSSDDPYVTLRSAYRQQRAFKIADGKVAEMPASDDPFEQPETTQDTPPEPQTQPQEQHSSLMSGSPATSSIDDKELESDAIRDSAVESPSFDEQFLKAD